jgi:hypothetical protein
MAIASSTGMISTPGWGETSAAGSSEAGGEAGGVVAPGGRVGLAAPPDDVVDGGSAVTEPETDPDGAAEDSDGGNELSDGGAELSDGGAEDSDGGAELSDGGAEDSDGGAEVSGGSVGPGGTNSTSHEASQTPIPSVPQFSPG